MNFKNIFDKNLKKHKLQVVANKIYQYFRDEKAESVDVPEFCKPYYERIEFKVKNELKRIEKSGDLDKFYLLAMQDS